MGSRSEGGVEGYYAANLSGERLLKCYEVAPPRVQQYLEAEIGFARERLRATTCVLELGCGYGRVTFRLAEVAERVIGIDTVSQTLALARRFAGAYPKCGFLQMDAYVLGFRDDTFDAVVCLQNGICAFGGDPEGLIGETIRVLRPGGRALFSTYAAEFWPERLRWFELQAAAGLLGEIDHEQTGDGVIVCKDGFRAGAFSPDAFRRLLGRFPVPRTITTVDESSVFCEILLPAATQPRHPADGTRCRSSRTSSDGKR
jgi:2-polyprenyl-6-hydroxyphenyl methylase/3-demethylubiquinone-9 3-methyltransferase